MGTSAFDRLWDSPPQKGSSAFDAAWDTVPAHDYHAEFKSGRLAKRMTRENANDVEQAAAETPDYWTQVSGGLASLAKDIPGAEALQAAIRSASSRPSPDVTAAMAQHPLLSSGADTPQSYREALRDIRGAEADAPKAVRLLNRTIGGVVAGSAIPLSPAKAGAVYGVASGLADANPDAGLGHRAADAAIKGALGAAGAKVAEAGTGWLRSALPSWFGGVKTLGANALGRKAAMHATDAANYGRAAAEGVAAGGTSPAIRAALAQPDIAPYVDAIRSSRVHAGADDATVLREVYKLMSERQGTLSNRIVNANDFKAGTSLENADVGLAKQELLRAAETPTGTAPAAMPSLRSAVEEHARQAGLRDAFRTGADATKRIVKGEPVAGKKLETNSPEAFAEAIPKMDQGSAQAALEGVLGRLKETNGASWNPLKGFGAFPNMLRASKLAPYIDALDRIGGTGAGSDAARQALVTLFSRIGLPSPAPQQ